jgi:hypothetical protein
MPHDADMRRWSITMFFGILRHNSCASGEMAVTVYCEDSINLWSHVTETRRCSSLVSGYGLGADGRQQDVMLHLNWVG